MSAYPDTRFPAVSAWIARTPIAHRGLHDAAAGCFENSLSAARAAIAQGFAIECDLQLAADGVPMVFHDDTLDRLTERTGSVRALTSVQLGEIAVGGSSDRIPTLRQLLDTVRGAVGLVVELKGQAGADAGFVAAVAREIERYDGPLALMSFYPWLVEEARALAPARPIGLTAEGDDRMLEAHRATAARASVDFVSYGIEDLPCAFSSEFRNSGRPVISWTIRSRDAMAKSALHADQITFEGFDPRAA